MIYTSEATGATIITKYEHEKQHMLNEAEELGCYIPEPIVYNPINTRSVLNPKKKYLIDNLELFLEDIVLEYFGVDIIAATFSIPCEGADFSKK